MISVGGFSHNFTFNVCSLTLYFPTCINSYDDTELVLLRIELLADYRNLLFASSLYWVLSFSPITRCLVQLKYWICSNLFIFLHCIIASTSGFGWPWIVYSSQLWLFSSKCSDTLVIKETCLCSPSPGAKWELNQVPWIKTKPFNVFQQFSMPVDRVTTKCSNGNGYDMLLTKWTEHAQAGYE